MATMKEVELEKIHQKFGRLARDNKNRTPSSMDWFTDAYDAVVVTSLKTLSWEEKAEYLVKLCDMLKERISCKYGTCAGDVSDVRKMARVNRRELRSLEENMVSDADIKRMDMDKTVAELTFFDVDSLQDRAESLISNMMSYMRTTSPRQRAKIEKSLEKQVKNAMEGKPVELMLPKRKWYQWFYTLPYHRENSVWGEDVAKDIKLFRNLLRKEMLERLKPFAGKVLSEETKQKAGKQFTESVEKLREAREGNKLYPMYLLRKNLDEDMKVLLGFNKSIMRIAAIIETGTKYDGTGVDKLAEKEKKYKGKSAQEVYEQRRADWKKISR